MLKHGSVVAIAVATLFSILVTTACSGSADSRTQPIVNVSDAALPVQPGTTMAQIQKAIVLAGGTRGWAIRPVAPGRLVGTLNIRKHMAEVDIAHTLTTFSITYKDSENLLYAKEGDTEYIHRNYNSWVGYLQSDIVRAVGLIAQ